MKKLLVFIISTSIIISFALGLSITAYAQTTSIPKWVKNTALWWGQGQISDDEFIKSMQWLIDNSFIHMSSQSNQNSPTSIPNSNVNTNQNMSPFSNTQCVQDEYGFVKMTGKYTNGAIPYSFVYLKLGVIDSKGTVVATGPGIVSDINAYETKLFDASASYSGQFSSCQIQVETQLPMMK